MQQKVVVITGATSGIGLSAAEQLASWGARLVLVARDQERGEAALARLRARAPNVAHSIHYADLFRLSEMKRVAAEIAAAEPRIDVLINNAGAIFGSRRVTEDGLERTFALNHLAYFVLTLGLRQRLLASSPARVINTASGSHKGLRERLFPFLSRPRITDSNSRQGRLLEFSDLQSANGYNPYKVYCRSKLCNVLFTRELARHFDKTGVTVNCLHPGFVATRFGVQGSGPLSRIYKILRPLAISPEKGAATVVYLATAPEVANVTGGYFSKCRLATPSKEALDDSASRRLWVESARIAGIENLVLLPSKIMSVSKSA